MSLTLAGKKIAILIANGFDENQMTEIQRALVKLQATSKTIAPENGVVNGWQGAGWGHYFPVDAFIGEALGSDYDALVIPGGERGVTKLKSNPHARRIIGHFLDAEKPVAAIGAGVELLTLPPGRLTGRSVSAPAEAQAALTAAGAVLNADPLTTDGTLLTATGGDLAGWVSAATGFFAEAEPVKEAA